MSEQTVQHRTGPRMRKATTEVDPFSEGAAETVRESATADDDEIVVQAKPLPAGDYALIETAPTSGVIVYVSEDAENYVKAAWHATRRMCQGRWTPSGWWIDPLTRTRIEMHPIVWRPADTSL